MAAMEERSAGKVITIQIMLTLILFSQVIIANGRCWWWGSPEYLLSFENRLIDDYPQYDMNKHEVKIHCDVWDYGTPDKTAILKPETSFTFCGGGYLFRDPTCVCDVSVNISDWKRVFIAFNDIDDGFDCKKTKHCHWQIRAEFGLLYSPTQNKYIQYDYKEKLD